MSLLQDKVILVENHHEALYFWKKKKFSNLPLMHIDAHSDLNPSFLKSKKVDIGNFIYIALHKNIISDFYWVIPGNKKDFSNYLPIIKKTFNKISPYDKNIVKKIYLSNNLLKTSVLGHRFIICTLDNLPVIKESVLLDIDTDFFIIKTLKSSINIAEIGKRTPWITVDNFYTTIKKKILNPKLISLAYSVNGGWTPMIYKTYADKLAVKFGLNNLKIKKNIQAGECFFQFRTAFERNDISQAKKFYSQAVKLNPSYNSQYNNYGYLHLLSGDLISAYQEFSTMVKINGKDRMSLFGMAIISLFKSEFKIAKEMLNKITRIDGTSQDLEIYIYLAFTEYLLNNLKNAEKYLNLCIKHHAYSEFSKAFKKKIENRSSFDNLSKMKKLELPYWLNKIIFHRYD